MKQFNIATDFYDFEYNGEKIKVQWNRQNYSLSDDYDRDDFKDRIAFTYKGISVYDFYESKNSDWYNHANKLCRIIDAGGKEAFEQYKIYDAWLEKIKNENIIVNNKVYKPIIKKIKVDRAYTWYDMSITMEDNTLIDGVDRSFFNKNERILSKKTEYSYPRTFETLVRNVLEYYKEKGIEPKQEFFQEELTKEYINVLNWFKEINLNI